MAKKLSVLVLVIFMSVSLTGCNLINKTKVKLGLSNKDFDYIKIDKVKQLVIQSNRDKGFKFIVTNEDVIREIYDLVSSAKKVDKKSDLQPDYIFEIHEKGGKIHKFDYIAGIGKKEGGNLYSENEIYIVSSRLDNDILKNFENIRKPRMFKDIYYKSILNVLNSYVNANKNLKDKKIALNLEEDIEVQRFILSSDIEEFKNELKSKYPMVILTNKNDQCYITLKVHTEGYTSTVYKSTLTFADNKNNTKKPKKYYTWSKYETRRWTGKVFEDNKPKDF